MSLLLLFLQRFAQRSFQTDVGVHPAVLGARYVTSIAYHIRNDRIPD